MAVYVSQIVGMQHSVTVIISHPWRNKNERLPGLFASPGADDIASILIGGTMQILSRTRALPVAWFLFAKQSLKSFKLTANIQ